MLVLGRPDPYTSKPEVCQIPFIMKVKWKPRVWVTLGPRILSHTSSLCIPELSIEKNTPKLMSTECATCLTGGISCWILARDREIAICLGPGQIFLFVSLTAASKRFFFTKISISFLVIAMIRELTNVAMTTKKQIKNSKCHPPIFPYVKHNLSYPIYLDAPSPILSYACVGWMLSSDSK